MTDVEQQVESGADHGMSRRTALGLAGAAAATVAGTAGLPGAAAAQAAGEASAPTSSPTSSPTVSLAQAERAVAAAIRYVEQNSLPPMFVVVVDVCGDEKASRRMDGNGAASVVLAPIKARTAAAFRTSTTTLAERAASPAQVGSITTAGFSLLGGGAPLLVRGGVVGAVGVGGGTPDQDAAVAAAAAAVL